MRRTAFTLVELLIVIIIIGILATMAVPQYNKMVEKAKWAKAVNALGALKNSIELYYVQYGHGPVSSSAADGYVFINGPKANPQPVDLKLDIDVPSADSSGRYLYGVYVDLQYLPATWAEQKRCAFAGIDIDGNGYVEPHIIVTWDNELIPVNGGGIDVPDF